MGMDVVELVNFIALAQKDRSRAAFQAEAYEERPTCNYARLLGVEMNATAAVSCRVNHRE